MNYALTEAGLAPRNFVVFDGTKTATAKSPMVGSSGAGELALRRHVIFYGSNIVAPVKAAAVAEVAAAVDTRSAAARRKTLVVAEVAAAVDTRSAVSAPATRKSAAVAEVAAAVDTQSDAATAVTPAAAVEFVKAMEDLFNLWRKMHP